MAQELTEAEMLGKMLGAYNGIYATSYKLAPYNPDLLTTQKGFAIYEQMLTMAACRAPHNVRRYAVLQKPWTVVPAITDPGDPRAEQAKTLAEAATWALSNILDPQTDEPQDFRAVLFELLAATWTGFQVTEIHWRRLDDGPFAGKLGFRRFYAAPPQQIGFDLDPADLSVQAIRPYTLAGGYGEPVPPAKVLRYTYTPEQGLPYGRGDGRACYKHWWSLDALLKFWGISLEVWGVPFLKAKYPSGNQQARAAALEVLGKIRQGAPALFPDDVDADVIAAGNGGALDVFRSAADWHTQQCATEVLGASLTTGEGRRTGSMALGRVHQDTTQTGLEFIKEDLEALITQQLLRRFVRVNFGPEAVALCPHLSLGDWDESDRLKTAQMFDLLIHSNVVHRRAKFIRHELGLPPLDPGEEEALNAEEALAAEQRQRAAEARLTEPGASGGARRAPATDNDTDEE